MDEKKQGSSAPKTEEKPKKKKRKSAKKDGQPVEKTERKSVVNRILAAILTLLLVVLALLVFVFRENLTEDGLRTLFDRSETAMLTGDAFTYETGSGQVFATAGNGLAVASSSAVQLLNAEGETVFKQVVSYGAPAISAADESVLFYDVGGKGCVIAGFDGESIAPGISENIITASMNANGWFALVTEEAGYKGLVRVYDAGGKAQYEWWSGSGYVLKAQLSPDNKRLVVLTADMEGSRLHFFDLRSETEQASLPFANELLFDFYYMGDTICALSEKAVHFVTGEGTEKARYEFGAQYLMDYEFGSGSFAVFYLSSYRTGGSGTLLSLDSSGNVLGSAAISREVLSMSAAGRQVLVMTSGDIGLYGQDMGLQSAVEDLMTAKKALLRPDGNVLLLSAYSAEKVKF